MKEVHLGIGPDVGCQDFDCPGVPEVIAQEDRYELGLRLPHAGVEGARVLAAFIVNQPDPGIGEVIGKLGSQAGSILRFDNDQQAPFRAGLPEQRLDRGLQKRRMVELEGHQRGDPGSGGVHMPPAR